MFRKPVRTYGRKKSDGRFRWQPSSVTSTIVREDAPPLAGNEESIRTKDPKIFRDDDLDYDPFDTTFDRLAREAQSRTQPILPGPSSNSSYSDSSDASLNENRNEPPDPDPMFDPFVSLEVLEQSAGRPRNKRRRLDAEPTMTTTTMTAKIAKPEGKRANVRGARKSKDENTEPNLEAAKDNNLGKKKSSRKTKEKKASKGTSARAPRKRKGSADPPVLKRCSVNLERVSLDHGDSLDESKVEESKPSMNEPHGDSRLAVIRERKNPVVALSRLSVATRASDFSSSTPNVTRRYTRNKSALRLSPIRNDPHRVDDSKNENTKVTSFSSKSNAGRVSGKFGDSLSTGKVNAEGKKEEEKRRKRSVKILSVTPDPEASESLFNDTEAFNRESLNTQESRSVQESRTSLGHQESPGRTNAATEPTRESSDHESLHLTYVDDDENTEIHRSPEISASVDELTSNVENSTTDPVMGAPHIVLPEGHSSREQYSSRHLSRSTDDEWSTVSESLEVAGDNEMTENFEPLVSGENDSIAGLDEIVTTVETSVDQSKSRQEKKTNELQPVVVLARLTLEKAREIDTGPQAVDATLDEALPSVPEVIVANEGSSSRSINEESFARNFNEGSFSRNFNEGSSSWNTNEESSSRNVNEESSSRNINEESSSRNVNEESFSRNFNEESSSRNFNEESFLRNVDEESFSRNFNAESSSRNVNEESFSRNVNEESSSRNLTEESSTRNVNEESSTRNIAEESSTRNIAEESSTRNIAEESSTRNIAEESSTRNITGESFDDIETTESGMESLRVDDSSENITGVEETSTGKITPDENGNETGEQFDRELPTERSKSSLTTAAGELEYPIDDDVAPFERSGTTEIHEKSREGEASKHPVVLLTRLNDPFRITRRRDRYRNWDVRLSAINEGKNEKVSSPLGDDTEKISPPATPDEEKEKPKVIAEESINEPDTEITQISGEMAATQPLLPDETCAAASFEINRHNETAREDKVVFLKPGKSWARSLSILSQVHSQGDLELLAAGKGRKWRESVQSLLGMQQQGHLQSCVRKNEDCNDLPLSSGVRNSLAWIPESSQSDTSRLFGYGSPTRFIRRVSIRVLPDRKSFRQVKDTSFLEAYGISPVEAQETDAQRCTLLGVAAPEKCLDIVQSPVTNVKYRDVVLAQCGQDAASPFEKCYPEEYLENCRKIGEGVYGEVFLYEKESAKSVIKIIPIEGETRINGERQKKFDEILSEIVIAKQLHNLRFGNTSSTSNFVEVKNVRCVIGKYPRKLIDLWKIFDDEKSSENDCPSIFEEDQLYIVLELGHGGEDLEAYVFQNASEAHALFMQAAVALAVAEETLEFEHRDLHWGNLLISRTDESQMDFRLNDKPISLTTKGVKVSVIDFTLSRMSYEGCSIFNDLAMDEDLFVAQGEYQFDIYRLMRKKLENDWQRFEPYTNVLWLHYLLDKMITAVRYRRKNTKVHNSGIAKLQELKNEILEYKSAADFVTSCDKAKLLRTSRTSVASLLTST